MTPENQGDNLGLGGGVAIVVTGQVPPFPPAVREPVLPVVLGAEHPVQAEEQQDQDDARGQTQSSHPGGRDTEKKEGEIKHQMTRKSITCVALVSILQLSKIPVILGKFKRIFLMANGQFQQDFQTCQ